ncbi:MAG: histidine phosphatase family protein [Myxococcota bacterium]
MTSLLMLIRHAESLWNAAGRWQGHGDPPLSPEGVRQAEGLAASLQSERPDRLVASDLQRARQTAAALGRTWSLEPELDGRLRELDIGTWTGLRREEIAAREPEVLRRFDAGDPELRVGGGESRAAIRQRARAFVEHLVARYPGERIAIVTHLGFVRALIPDAEPGNVEVIRLRAGDLLQRRTLDAPASPPAGPL